MALTFYGYPKCSTCKKAEKWLACDGMLLKRPIVTDGEVATIGCREDAFKEAWVG